MSPPMFLSHHEGKNLQVFALQNGFWQQDAAFHEADVLQCSGAPSPGLRKLKNPCVCLSRREWEHLGRRNAIFRNTFNLGCLQKYRYFFLNDTGTVRLDLKASPDGPRLPNTSGFPGFHTAALVLLVLFYTKAAVVTFIGR